MVECADVLAGRRRAVAAYNTAFVLSFPLTALATHALAFAHVKRHDAAILAGLMFGFNPYRIAQAPHIQMMWVFWMPLALWAACQFIGTGRPAWLVTFAAAW